jgi:hypothetical protein
MLRDCKMFCFANQPRLIQVDLDRHADHTRAFFDVDWHEQPYSLLYPKAVRAIERPRNLDEMLRVAAALSAPFEFVRVDLYSNDEDCLVGEITHCHGSAEERFIPADAEVVASRLLFG